MKRIVLSNVLAIVLISSLFVFNSCEKDHALDADNSMLLKRSSSLSYDTYAGFSDAIACGSYQEVQLLAGQTKNAGTVRVFNTDDSVYVVYQTTQGYFLNDIKVYLGSLTQAPLNDGNNPVLGHFPVRISNLPSQTTLVTIAVASTSLEDSFIVAAYAEVYKTTDNKITDKDGAWGSGQRFNTRGNWATYFDFSKQECGFEYEENCQIATRRYTIYADRIYQIGRLEVTNNNENAIITYRSFGNWYFRKTYLYAGTLLGLPVDNDNNPVVSKFPYIVEHSDYLQSYSYSILLKNLPAGFIIVAYSEYYDFNSSNNPEPKI